MFRSPSIITEFLCGKKFVCIIFYDNIFMVWVTHAIKTPQKMYTPVLIDVFTVLAYFGMNHRSVLFVRLVLLFLVH